MSTPNPRTAGRARHVGDRDTGLVTAYLARPDGGPPRVAVAVTKDATTQGGSLSLEDAERVAHLLAALVAAGRAAAQA